MTGTGREGQPGEPTGPDDQVEWSGAEVVRDQGSTDDAPAQPWGGDQVVRDADVRDADEDSTAEPGGWSGGQMVADDLDQSG